MKRKQATALIDEIRIAIASVKEDGKSHQWAFETIDELLIVAGLPQLKRCEGEAHSNAFIDNCMVCAPRWGWCGKLEKIT